MESPIDHGYESALILTADELRLQAFVVAGVAIILIALFGVVVVRGIRWAWRRRTTSKPTQAGIYADADQGADELDDATLEAMSTAQVIRLILRIVKQDQEASMAAVLAELQVQVQTLVHPLQEALSAVRVDMRTEYDALVMHRIQTTDHLALIQNHSHATQIIIEELRDNADTTNSELALLRASLAGLASSRPPTSPGHH